VTGDQHLGVGQIVVATGYLRRRDSVPLIGAKKIPVLCIRSTQFSHKTKLNFADRAGPPHQASAASSDQTGPSPGWGLFLFGPM
jgi:hypothetical protein